MVPSAACRTASWALDAMVIVAAGAKFGPGGIVHTDRVLVVEAGRVREA